MISLKDNGDQSYETSRTKRVKESESEEKRQTIRVKRDELKDVKSNESN